MKTLSILINKTATFLLKFINRGGSLPGQLALKCDKNILKQLNINGKVIVVTGTNGKTSTSNMLAELFIDANKVVISNRKGDNLKEGITTQLLNHADLKGTINCDYCVFECDELNVPFIVKNIKVDALIVTNFFRDQLDRAHEMERIISRLENSLKDYDGTLVLNGNDPNVMRLAHVNNKVKVLTFGMNQYSESTHDDKEASEGKFCPLCNTKLEYKFYQYSHIGSFACPSCHFKTPETTLLGNVLDIDKHEFSCENVLFKASQGGLYTMYNCMAVLSIAKLFNIDFKHAQNIFAAMEIPAGRNEKFEYNGHDLIMNLIKNPTGANEVMKVMEADQREKAILFVINDNWGDGTDISWLYDTLFEKMMNEQTKTIICSGTRCYDMALRLKYGGWNGMIQIEENLETACDLLLQNDYERYAVVTYTGIANTRKILRRKIK